MEYESVKILLPFTSAPKRGERATYVDIETRKVRCSPIKRGLEIVRTRWEPFMIGTGFHHDGSWWAELNWGWEGQEWVAWTSGMREHADSLFYSATREFDEMVLKGRFTNARRAHWERRPAGWPGIAEDRFSWTNLKQKTRLPRGADVASRDVPQQWYAGNREAVLIHCLRDVIEMMATDLDEASAAAPMLNDYDLCARVLEDE